MKFGTYNVEAGGFDNYRDYETTTPPRLDAIQDVVAGLDADVVSLIDTFRWHELYTPADLRAIFEYDHAITMPIADQTIGRADNYIGVTLLSRRELIGPGPISIGERQALATDIELDSGDILSLFAAYLNHQSEAIRTGQADKVIEHALLSGEHRVIMGDLNTIARSDNKPPLRQLLQLLLDAAGNADMTDVRDILKGEAYHHFVEAGFEDANKDRLATWPTPRRRILGRVAIPPILRPDHILHSRSLRSSQGDVPKSGVVRYASDHFPLVADILPR
jgi:endonuclease/exonuclease/phosphatase family metal-dependent hydrolase